jgi:diacylglycerol kinase family enzyme
LRVIVLHNPTAGDAEHRPQAIVSALEEAGHDVEWESTKEDGWEAALDRGAELFVVAGGDGTVQKVFRRLAGKDVPVTLLPVGSANNVARSLGFDDDDPGRLVRGWPSARRVACDVGSISSGQEQHRFVESAGGGAFADALERAEEADGDLGADEKIEQGLGRLHKSLAAARPAPWELSVDGDDLSAELVGLEVLNVRDLGPRITLAPEADPTDGLLNVVLIRNVDAAALAAYVDERREGGLPELPAFDVRTAREIVFRPPLGTPLHYDDDLLDAREASVSVVGRVRVLVPTASVA